MKINFLGDSITFGAGASKIENTYTYLVAKHVGAEECNFGVGGTRIAKQVKRTFNPDNDVFMCRAVWLPKDADFTFVFGGTNDYGHGDAAFGCFDDRDDYTFYGAFHNLVSYMVATFGKKLCFILPLPRYNQDDPYGEGGKEKAGPVLQDYIEAEKEVLDFYGVEYLDFSEYFPTPQGSPKCEWAEDGLHPNDAGHKRLADLLIDYLTGKIA